MNTKVQEFIEARKRPGERFLPVKGFEARFFISDHGSVISIDGRYKEPSFLYPHLDSLGYYSATLRMKPLKRKCRIHQLVGEHFCEMKAKVGRMTWNHIDGNKRNNLYSNLEYISMAENSKHAVESGLHNLKGINHPQSKLNENQVREIRSLYTTGLTQQAIAEKFGICRRQAGDIINRKNWGWLT